MRLCHRHGALEGRQRLDTHFRRGLATRAPASPPGGGIDADAYTALEALAVGGTEVLTEPSASRANDATSPAG